MVLNLHLLATRRTFVLPLGCSLVKEAFANEGVKFNSQKLLLLSSPSSAQFLVLVDHVGCCPGGKCAGDGCADETGSWF